MDRISNIGSIAETGATQTDLFAENGAELILLADGTENDGFPPWIIVEGTPETPPAVAPEAPATPVKPVPTVPVTPASPAPVTVPAPNPPAEGHNDPDKEALEKAIHYGDLPDVAGGMIIGSPGIFMCEIVNDFAYVLGSKYASPPGKIVSDYFEAIKKLFGN